MNNIRNIIGRAVKIRVDGHIYTGTVIDRTDTNCAKRIRIQSKGKRQGDVAQRHEYEFIEFVR